MTDQTDIREQIAAFLAGDLDPAAADALQGRIDAEPWVARLADEMADMLVVLGQVDDVPLPLGFSDRLRTGLATELGRPVAAPLPGQAALRASSAAAATGWAQETRPRPRGDASRPSAGRGGPRRRHLSAAWGVAAVFAILAIGGVGVLSQSGMFGASDSEDSAFSNDESAELAVEGEDRSDLEDIAAGAGDAAAEDTADAGAAATQAAPAAAEPFADAAQATEDDDEADDANQEEAADDDAADSRTPSPAPSPTTPDRPAMLTLGTVEDDDDTIAQTIGGHPSAQALLGTSAADVVELAAAYRDELLRGPVFGDATAAGTCLTDTLDAAGQDLVPAVAARLDLPDGPAVAYALVRSRDGATLDAVDVWILDLPGCGIDRVIRQG